MRTPTKTPDASPHRKPAAAGLELDLAESVEKVKREIRQCKSAEDALRSGRRTSGDLLGKSRQLQKDLRHLSRQLLSTHEEERRRISRELHDVIAQALTGVHVRLAALKSGPMSNNKGWQREIASTQRLVEKSVDLVDRFARELRPTVLDDLGLIPALQSYMRRFTEETGIRVSLKAYAAIQQSNAAKRTVLYRVAQEALKNVARHAGASRAEVSLQRQNGRIRMEIRDNGKGFAVRGRARSQRGGGSGILEMRERVEMMGGNFHVESAPGMSTVVRVEIPAE